MPECPACHVAVIAAVQSASAVRDVGVAGAVSIAAASALGIGYKRRLFDGPVACAAASASDADETERDLDADQAEGDAIQGGSFPLAPAAPLPRCDRRWGVCSAGNRRHA
jgi:hypothetical protein